MIYFLSGILVGCHRRKLPLGVLASVLMGLVSFIWNVRFVTVLAAEFSQLKSLLYSLLSAILQHCFVRSDHCALMMCPSSRCDDVRSLIALGWPESEITTLSFLVGFYWNLLSEMLPHEMWHLCPLGHDICLASCISEYAVFSKLVTESFARLIKFCFRWNLVFVCQVDMTHQRKPLSWVSSLHFRWQAYVETWLCIVVTILVCLQDVAWMGDMSGQGHLTERW
jgi:hypothetical protein